MLPSVAGLPGDAWASCNTKGDCWSLFEEFRYVRFTVVFRSIPGYLGRMEECILPRFNESDYTVRMTGNSMGKISKETDNAFPPVVHEGYNMHVKTTMRN